MRKSLSQSFISSALEQKKKKPQDYNFTLTGSLSKKVFDKHSAKWDGLTLELKAQDSRIKKSPMRWQEYERSRRTINPEFSDEFQPYNHKKTLNSSKSGTITDMITKGYTEEKPGNLSKKVLLRGQRVTANAESYENTLISNNLLNAYKGIHTGQCPASEKRHKIASAISEEKKASQISTLPCGPKEPKLSKPAFLSTPSEQFIKTYNPCIAVKRYTATSTDKEVILKKTEGKYRIKDMEYAGIKQSTCLDDKLNNSKGKMRDFQAEERMFRGNSPERESRTPRKPRPASVTNAFKPSYKFF